MWAQRKQLHFRHLTNSFQQDRINTQPNLLAVIYGAGWAHCNCFSKAMRPLWLQWEGHMLGLVFQIMMHIWQCIKMLKRLGRLLISPHGCSQLPFYLSLFYPKAFSFSILSYHAAWPLLHLNMLSGSEQQDPWSECSQVQKWFLLQQK